MVHGKLFLFASFLLKTEQKPFPGRIIIFYLQVHDGADSGESVGKDSKQSAIAEPRVRGCLDHAQKLLNFAFDKCRRFPILAIHNPFPVGYRISLVCISYCTSISYINITN